MLSDIESLHDFIISICYTVTTTGGHSVIYITIIDLQCTAEHCSVLSVSKHITRWPVENRVKCAHVNDLAIIRTSSSGTNVQMWI